MPEMALEGKNILIIEDEYFIADDLKRAFAAKRARVVGPTGSFAAGADLAGKSNLDGAVLDVNLAGQPSYPIADALIARGVPFLFLTGYDGWAMPQQYRGVPRLLKSHSTDGVVTTLAKILAGRVS